MYSLWNFTCQIDGNIFPNVLLVFSQGVMRGALRSTLILSHKCIVLRSLFIACDFIYSLPLLWNADYWVLFCTCINPIYRMIHSVSGVNARCVVCLDPACFASRWESLYIFLDPYSSCICIVFVTLPCKFNILVPSVFLLSGRLLCQLKVPCYTDCEVPLILRDLMNFCSLNLHNEKNKNITYESILKVKLLTRTYEKVENLLPSGCLSSPLRLASDYISKVR